MFILKSHAKINLCLKIIDQLPDGYHSIFSAIAPIGLHDIIKINENKTYSCSVFMGGKYGTKFDNTDEDEIEKNLIIKMFNILHKKYRIPVYFDVYVEKQIPLMSGLGGGSSNAAAVLNFCNQYFDIGMTSEQMVRIALLVGCDVAFFLENSTAICEGKGEIMTQVNYEQEESLPALIVIPNFGIRTVDAYHLAKRSKNDGLENIDRWKKELLEKSTFSDFIRHASGLGNDLDSAAVKIRPEIQSVLTTISKMDEFIGSGMSGSGSACFGVCGSDADLCLAATKIRSKFPSFEIITTTVNSCINDVSFIKTSRPSMETIFHNPENEGGWETIL